MKISTIYFSDEDFFKKVKEIAQREKKSISEISRIALADYVKIHGEGNNAFTMDNWINHPEFIAVPALMADSDFIKGWLKHNKADEKTIREIQFKLQEWEHLIKQWDYGKL